MPRLDIRPHELTLGRLVTLLSLASSEKRPESTLKVSPKQRELVPCVCRFRGGNPNSRGISRLQPSQYSTVAVELQESPRAGFSADNLSSSTSIRLQSISSDNHCRGCSQLPSGSVHCVAVGQLWWLPSSHLIIQTYADPPSASETYQSIVLLGPFRNMIDMRGFTRN